MVEKENKASEKAEYRIEYGSTGERQIPKGTYYEVQTPHAAGNSFIIGLKMHPEPINSFTQIKKTATITNSEMGRLDKKRVDAVVQAYDEIMSNKLYDEFIANPTQDGAGTSFNMNVNEVVANRATEILGGEGGDYPVVSLNDHVNYGQSTSNVFPSCGKLTTLKLLYEAQAELERLYHVLMEKSEEFNHVIKMGWTQLQDAVPIRLGQEFHVYATAIRRDTNHLGRAKEEMRHLSLGGTAVGTGLNTDVKYLQWVAKNISLISNSEPTQIYDLIDAAQNLDGYVVCSGIVESCAVNLSRMCNDLRPMSSGPRTRLREINLPTKQDGSSIMPRKVNPVIPEVVDQVAFHVIGNDMTVAMAAGAEQLELDAFEPTIFYKLFQPVETIVCVVHTLVDNCTSGIMTDGQHCKDTMGNSVGIVTAICPYVGYEKAANVAKEAIRADKSIRELVIRDKLLIKEQLGIVLNPVSVTEPGTSGTEAMSKTGGL